MRGIFDDILGVIDSLGISASSALAVERAFASPTITNIQNVELAFNAEGTSAPPELMQELWNRYNSAVQSNPQWQTGSLTASINQMLPYLVIGGIAIFAFSMMRK
jgi:hypothetical protein